MEELKVYSEMDLMRFFGEFGRGIDEMEKVAKKFKRKKIEFDRKDIDEAITYFINREQEYYRSLRLLVIAKLEDKQALKEELSLSISNYFLFRDEMLEWEFKTMAEQGK
jgi:hypothetical protein